MTDGIKASTIAPAPDVPKPKVDKPDPVEIKVAETLKDGTVVLQLPDGRMFHAEADESLSLRKGSKVEIKSEGEDGEGVPQKATVSRVL